MTAGMIPHTPHRGDGSRSRKKRRQGRQLQHDGYSSFGREHNADSMRRLLYRSWMIVTQTSTKVRVDEGALRRRRREQSLLEERKAECRSHEWHEHGKRGGRTGCDVDDDEMTTKWRRKRRAAGVRR